MRGAPRAVVVLALGAARPFASATLLAIASMPATAVTAVAQEAPPDVVVIVTDDQRFDSLWAMPVVREELVERGASFPDAFVVNPICCPSRASILTGAYSHSTGVYRQAPPHGRWEWFRDGSTLATWLDDAGYTTALVGKYLDGYQHAALTGVVPPGWDRWVAFVHSAYLDYKLTVDGDVRPYGSAPEDYSTEVLGREAAAFVRSAEGPLFLYLAPAAPHGPAPPAPGDETAFAGLEPWRPPSYDETDVSDKPAWVRALPPMGATERARVDALRRNQYASLLAVDRAVGEVLDALRETGRLDDTLIVFTSDNGLAWGEHRWSKKEAPYEEVIRVPLVVRWDAGGVLPGSHPEALALNIDLAPTIAEAAGIDAPGADGMSLLPALRGTAETAPREDFLVEHLEGTNPVPTYCAVRSRTWSYVRYTGGEEELYDLASDPWQLENLAGDPAAAADLDTMRARLEALCDPPPPGYLDAGFDARIALALAVFAAVFLVAALRTRFAITQP